MFQIHFFISFLAKNIWKYRRKALTLLEIKNVKMELSDFERAALAQCTPQEKECIFQAVSAAMTSDGESGAREKKLLEEVKAELALTDEEVEAAKALDKQTMIVTIRNMNYFKRLSTGKLLTQMVYADNIVTQSEQLFILNVFDQFNIPVAD